MLFFALFLSHGSQYVCVCVCVCVVCVAWLAEDVAILHRLSIYRKAPSHPWSWFFLDC